MRCLCGHSEDTHSYGQAGKGEYDPKHPKVLGRFRICCICGCFVPSWKYVLNFSV